MNKFERLTGKRPYVCLVRKSNRHIYVDLLDRQGKVLGCISSLSPELLKSAEGLNKNEQSFLVGKAFAVYAFAKGLAKDSIIFCINNLVYRPNSRVDFLAKGMREAGLLI